MNRTTGVKEAHIIELVWKEESRKEYYSSISALYAKNGEDQIGATRNTVRCNLSRKGGHENGKVKIEYVPIFVAVRGKKE